MTDTSVPTRPAGKRGLILRNLVSGVMFKDHLTAGLTAPSNPFDYAGPLRGKLPMAVNDSLGDCTIAGVIHLLQIVFSVLGQTFAYPGDEAVAAYYWKLCGVQPQSADDPGPGLDMLTVIDDGLANGWFGVPIVAYGQLEVTNWLELVTAAYNFGVVYLAVDLPQSAESDFSEHKLWTPSGSGIGGHCITGSGDTGLATYAGELHENRRVTSQALLDTETWGDETAFTEAWWRRYGQQAFVIIPKPFVDAGHGPLANVNVATLEAACQSATGARLAA